MMMKIDSNQAKTLATFISQIRPGWDPQGIYAALGKARDMAPAPQLAIAAIQAAMDDTNRTPAVIAMQGDHWTTPATTTNARPGGREPRCDVYGHEGYPARNCAGCRAEQLAGTTTTTPTGRDLAAGKDH